MENWQKARKVLHLVQVSNAFDTLRDMIPEDAFIDNSRIKVMKELGQGGFAFVNLCTLDGTQHVAVKSLRPELLRGIHDIQIFIEENNLLRKLRNKYIIEYIGMGVEAMSSSKELKQLYLVEEYCAGGSLQELVFRQMQQPTKKLYTHHDALRWCLGVAKALKYLHGAKPKVIHRDLKLDNLLLTDRNISKACVKLADFGLAKLMRAGGISLQSEEIRTKVMNMLSKTTLESTTSAKMLNRIDTFALEASTTSQDVSNASIATEMTGEAGSYGYMSPEVLQWKKYDEKADIFSFAMVMYNLFYRIIPSALILTTGSPDDLLVYACNVSHGYRPALSTQKSGLKEINDLIQKCWNGVPSLRPSAEEIVNELKRIEKEGLLSVGNGDSMRSGASAGGCCAMM